MLRIRKHCGSTPPTKEQIAHLVYITGAMLDRYGDALVKVIYGFVEPREAAEEISIKVQD